MVVLNFFESKMGQMKDSLEKDWFTIFSKERSTKPSHNHTSWVTTQLKSILPYVLILKVTSHVCVRQLTLCTA